MKPRAHHAPSYRHVARLYDALASAYSLGAIDRAKRLHHKLIQPGGHVLYVGAGQGREIAEACRRGADVTCVEPCPAMAAKLHTRLSSSADDFAIVPKPIQSISAQPMYDLVVAHFFLNVFDQTTMPEVLAHLCGFVKPGGRLIIADFKPNDAPTNVLARLLRSTYYRPLNLAGQLLRIGALHPIYDYAPLLLEHGFQVTARRPAHVIASLPPLYETIIVERIKEPPSRDGG